MLSAVKRKLHIGSPLENAPKSPSPADRKIRSLVSSDGQTIVVQENPMFKEPGKGPERARVRTYSFNSRSGSTVSELTSRSSTVFREVFTPLTEGDDPSPPVIASRRALDEWRRPSIMRPTPGRGSGSGSCESASVRPRRLTTRKTSSTARAILSPRANSGLADLEVAQAAARAVPSGSDISPRRISRVRKINEGPQKPVFAKPPLTEFYQPSLTDKVINLFKRGRAKPMIFAPSGEPQKRIYHSNHMDFDRSVRPGVSRAHVTASGGKAVPKELQAELPHLQSLYAFSRVKPSDDQLEAVLDVLQEIRTNGGVVKVKSADHGKVQFDIDIPENSKGLSRGEIKKLEKLGATLIKKGYKVDCSWREGERLDPTMHKAWVKKGGAKKIKVAISAAGLLLLLAV